ncbi:hypothetical protein BP5796_08538 [Coleophoma crateriformis]|uniref:ABC1 atypical kinase-like domain-containing protein n=1 Tax=Coleophoma crateriformis TaxID=565419 RepID=A0A3D8R885_9HELO|nr:hypothetical protein BP5796_08538 [Coleophoma crateriformis]
MAGRRLLDLAALFNASRGVAQKHIALRSQQLDVYSRTSSLAKAVRNQTDRVTETVKAASFLASRLNDNAPAWTTEATTDEVKDKREPIPSRTSTKAAEAAPKQEEALEQDHFYERSSKNSSTDPPATGDLDIQQKQADRYPLPDGSIPPADSSIFSPQIDKDSTPTRPLGEPAKDPLGKGGLEIKQEKADQFPLRDGTIPSKTTGSNTHSIDNTPRAPGSSPLTPDVARSLQRDSEFQIPSQSADAEGDSVARPLQDGHDEDVFYKRSGHTSPTLSSLPRVKIPKYPSDSQGGDEHLPNNEINSDTYYNPLQGSKQQGTSTKAIPEQEEVPEGIDTALFHSPRVARLLGAKTQRPVRDGFDPRTDQEGSAKTNPMVSKDHNTPEFVVSSEKPSAEKSSTEVPYLTDFQEGKDDFQRLADEIGKATNGTAVEAEVPSAQTPPQLRESKVPSSRLGRLWNYGGLAAGMFGGAISESIRRVSGSGGEGSFMLSAGNMDRLVAKLSRMRGAALKLGQMLSFQDSKMLPAPIQEVLQRVQDRADYMPASQRNRVLVANLGPDWRDLFLEFEEVPMAAASIGQVHKAILKATGQPVAVKVQYPGVADSIDSDLNNLAVLLTASRLLPKGLFLDKTIANARTELGWECDYIREAECGRRFGDLLADETAVFVVPKTYPEASGKQVITMEFMEGVGVTRVHSFTQEQKDWIGTQILRLCLREITEFQFMQTDPNWTNFLYNAKTNKLELLDFGASREYPKEFITKYTRLLAAASKSDRNTVRDLSIGLGYLTGHESKAMLDAHIKSVLTLAEPFLESSPEVYDFQDQTITERVKALIPVMIRERLSPPPEETYSLHRKLSGAFLLCARLGSRVRCRELFENSMREAGI